jgi:hypothetical protein
VDEQKVATKELVFTIPEDLQFSDLELRLDDDGLVRFNWEAIERLCATSNINPDFFSSSRPEYVGNLISHWYGVHLYNGGAHDPEQERALSYGDTMHWGSDQFQHRAGTA